MDKTERSSIVISKVTIRQILEAQNLSVVFLHVSVSQCVTSLKVRAFFLVKETVTIKQTFKASCSPVIWTEKFSGFSTATQSHY